jgi:hypothetical protein
LIAEHVFVTTLSSSQVILAVKSMLEPQGFVAQSSGAFSLAGDESMAVEFVRAAQGRQSFRLHRLPRSFPQSVRVEFDRGRVTVAASLVNLAVDLDQERIAKRGWGTKFKQLQGQQQIVMAHCTAVENVLNRGMDPSAAYEPVRAAEMGYADLTRSGGRGCLIALLVILIAIVISVVVSLTSR